jgi:hypothetical protein
VSTANVNRAQKKTPNRKRPDKYVPRVHNRYRYLTLLQEQNSVVSMGDSPAAVAPSASVGAGQATVAGPAVASAACDGAGEANDGGPAVQPALGLVSWQSASAQPATENVGRAQIEVAQCAPSFPPPATSPITPPHFEPFPRMASSYPSLPPPRTNPYPPIHLYTYSMSGAPQIADCITPIVPPKLGSNAQWGDGDGEVLIQKPRARGPNAVHEPAKPTGLSAARENTANAFASGKSFLYHHKSPLAIGARGVDESHSFRSTLLCLGAPL